MNNKNQTTTFKILIILASALLLGLFLLGIIQTFTHKSLQAKTKEIEGKNNAVQTEIDQRQKDEAFINDPNAEIIIVN